MSLVVSTITIRKATLTLAFELGKKIKKHLSKAEGRKLLAIVYLLIDDVIAQIRAKKQKPTYKRVLDAVLPTILRIEERSGWQMPNMSEETEDRFLTWLVGRAVSHRITGTLSPSRE